MAASNWLKRVLLWVLAIGLLTVVVLGTLSSCRDRDPTPPPRPGPTPGPQPEPGPGPTPNPDPDPGPNPTPETITGRVRSVMAADKLWVKVGLIRGVRVKIRGIEAPDDAAESAEEFVESLFEEVGDDVTVRVTQSDRKITTGDVILQNGWNLGHEIVRMGWARVNPATTDDQLRELETAAKKSRVGIWAEDDDGGFPWPFRYAGPEAWGEVPEGLQE